MSLKIAPGVRIRASATGIRTSVGPRVARVHVGAGKTAVSSGFGPFSASSTVKNRRPTAKASPPSRRERVPPSKVDTFVAGVELAAGVAEMIGYAFDRRQAKQLAADSTKAVNLLTTLHVEDFSGPAKPVPPPEPPPPRRWRRLREISNTNRRADVEAMHAEAQAIYAEELERWNLLLAHDSHEVIAAVEDALADNASQSACIDAGSGPFGNYVTIVVHYPGLEIAEGIVQAGARTRTRTEQEKIEIYRRAVASTIIASAKEALVHAPAANEAYVIVLRHDLQGRRKKSSQLDAIYAGVFGRRILQMDWTSNSPLDLMLSAREARFNCDRKGRLLPLGDAAGDDLRRIITAVVAAQTAPERHRYSRDESLRLMEIQVSEPFCAICACPGCGAIEAHALRSPRTGEPDWAATIRSCANCAREWAQA